MFAEFRGGTTFVAPKVAFHVGATGAVADIFISYARADREAAKVFADAFVAQGWSVWWDPEISYGAQYDKAIEAELAQAKCVVVLWSSRSVESRWVRSEASQAAERDALVPVRIEANIAVPLEFTKIQTANLLDWDGDRDNPTFKRLLSGVERTIRASGSTGEMGGRPTLAEQRPSVLPRPRLLVRLGVLVAPTAVALFLAVVAMQIHRPTAFDLDLTVSKVAFVSGADRAALLVDKIAFTQLSLHGVATGTIAAERVQLDTGVGKSKEASPRISLPVTISQRRASGANVAFVASRGSASAIGELNPLFLSPGKGAELAVTPEKPPRLWVRVLDQPTRIVLSLLGASKLELVDAMIKSGGAAPIEAAVLMLQLEPAASGSMVEIVGASTGLTLVLAPAADLRSSATLVSDLQVSEIHFQTQGPTGAAITTLSGDGTIGFLEAPDKAKITLESEHYLALRDLRNFYLRKLDFEPEKGAMHVKAGGLAGSLRSGPVGGVQERALTWFDSIWQQPRSLQLFGLAVWLFPTTLAAYRLFEELKR